MLIYKGGKYKNANNDVYEILYIAERGDENIMIIDQRGRTNIVSETLFKSQFKEVER